jgi:hypothetical protein
MISMISGSSIVIPSGSWRAEHVERTEVVDLGEAPVDLRLVETLEWIVDVGAGELEEHRPELVVDLFVVGALGLARQAGGHVAEADLVEQARVAEHDVERHVELDRPVGEIADLDPLVRQQIEKLIGDFVGRYLGAQGAGDLAVGPERHGGELVGDGRVDRRVVAVVVVEYNAHRRQVLLVGDELLCRRDDAPGDRELGLLVEGVGQSVDDAVVLADEQGVDRREGDVLVRPLVAGGDRGVPREEETTHTVHVRALDVVALVHQGQVAVGGQESGRVVRRVAVDGPLTQPVEPFRGAAVHVGGVDVRAQLVDLLGRYSGALAGALCRT